MLRARLIGGQRAKASRGELEMKLPIGLVQDAAGKVVLDPDLQVQEAVRTPLLCGSGGWGWSGSARS